VSRYPASISFPPGLRMMQSIHFALFQVNNVLSGPARTRLCPTWEMCFSDFGEERQDDTMLQKVAIAKMRTRTKGEM